MKYGTRLKMSSNLLRVTSEVMTFGNNYNMINNVIVYDILIVCGIRSIQSICYPKYGTSFTLRTV